VELSHRRHQSPSILSPAKLLPELPAGRRMPRWWQGCRWHNNMWPSLALPPTPHFSPNPRPPSVPPVARVATLLSNRRLPTRIYHFLGLGSLSHGRRTPSRQGHRPPPSSAYRRHLCSGGATRRVAVWAIEVGGVGGKMPPNLLPYLCPSPAPPPPPLAVAALKDLVLGYSHRDPPPSATSYFNSH
jgi:hypothetical protein